MHIRGIHSSHTTTAPAMSVNTDDGDTGSSATTGTHGNGVDHLDPGATSTSAGTTGDHAHTNNPTSSGTPSTNTASGNAPPSDADTDTGIDTGAGSDTRTTSRSTPLRVDAQRNLEHVLRAAREVFGELGYGAPMEDVARRARVGVGTVYRRFPSKEVLVRRIAAEETARLTEQARTALSEEEEPWSALARFLRTSVASGAGRLLPPRILRADGWGDAGQADETVRVPQQRQSEHEPERTRLRNGQPDLRLVSDTEGRQPAKRTPATAAADSASAAAVATTPSANQISDDAQEEPGTAELLDMVGQLVQRARDAGELRTDVTVGDVLLLIATAAPSLPDAAQQAAASKRLLDILLEGLRPHPRT